MLKTNLPTIKMTTELNIDLTIEKFQDKLFDIVSNLLKGNIKRAPIIRLTKSKKSPVLIPFNEIENSFIIFYPPNSDHYVDDWDGVKKSCKILEGTIYNSTDGRVFGKGESFDIKPDEKMDPYTKDQYCIAFVQKFD